MITLTLSASLAAMLPQFGNDSVLRTRSIEVDANSWPEAVADIRHRYDGLARHVFDETGHLRPGFLVAIKEEVQSGRDEIPEICPGDELFLFTQIAGG